MRVKKIKCNFAITEAHFNGTLFLFRAFIMPK